MVEKIQTQKLTYSISEAAEVLGVSTSKMYQIVKIEGFPLLTLGKRRLVPIKGLERWVENMAGAGTTRSVFL